MRFEEDFKNFVINNPELGFKIIADNTGSMEDIDFILSLNDVQKPIAIDLKEKKSRSRKVWADISRISQETLTVFDESSVKKLFYFYPYGFFAIFDVEAKEYTLLNSLDLLCCPKARVNRPIERQTKSLKGKWIVDLSWGKKGDLKDVLINMRNFLTHDLENNMKRLECYGSFNGEELQTLEDAYKRTPDHWRKDLGEK